MTSLVLPPVVYLGPSAPAGDVRQLLPKAQLRPPIRRGDLYRDRILRFGVFVVIDGVFEQELAISPREVVDVVEDGAAVIGASSMGALRAADCRPAGAVGVGCVYRLFRRRAIGSEDEVAVSFLPDCPYPPLSESLVNIRVALRRAARRGVLDLRYAERMVRVATRLRHVERSWRRVLDEIPCPDQRAGVAQFVSRTDVKREDARCAFRLVANLLRADPDYARRPRSGGNLFGLIGEGRERGVDPLFGASVETVRPDFVRWALASGRTPHEIAPLALLERLLAGETAAVEETVWRALANLHDIDAALLRYQAFRFGVREAELHGLTSERADKLLAEDEIAHGQGYQSWSDLTDALKGKDDVLDQVRALREKIACTKHFRRYMFSVSARRAREGRHE